MNKFYPNNAIVVIDGEYKGWVGYVEKAEDKEQQTVLVMLFASNGDRSLESLDIDYVFNVEPVLLKQEELQMAVSLKEMLEQSRDGVSENIRIRRIDRSPRGEQRFKEAVKASNLIASLVPDREDVDWDVQQDDMGWAEDLAFETLGEGF